MIRAAIKRMLRTATTHRWAAAAAIFVSTAAASRPDSSVVMLVRNDNVSAARVFVSGQSVLLTLHEDLSRSSAVVR